MCWEDHDVRVSRPFVCVCLSVRQVMMWRRILWLKQGRYEIVVPHVYQCTLTHVEVMSLYSCYLEDCEILKTRFQRDKSDDSAFLCTYCFWFRNMLIGSSCRL